MSEGTTPVQGLPPRRRSIFGPLIWITIGGLLLANNLGANIRIYDLFWKYWPLFLIVLGLVKIFEHFAAQSSGQTPARILSGGEIVLLIFLFLIFGGVSGFRHAVETGDIDVTDVPWWNSYSFTEEASKAIKPGLPITITTTRGGITVRPADIAEVRVVNTKSVSGNDEADAEARAKGYGVTIEESAGGCEVRTQAPAGRSRRVTMSLEVQVPRQSAITIRTDSGHVEVSSGLTGDVTIQSGNGHVEVRDVTGKVRIEGVDNVTVAGVQGDVEVSGRLDDIEISNVTGITSVRGDIYGSARLKNIGKQTTVETNITRLTLASLKGRLDLASGDLEVVDVPGNVELTTRNKDIRFENITGRIQVDNRRTGDVEIRLAQPPQQPIEIENEKGSVTLTLPSVSTFEIQASSERGETESDFQDGISRRTDNRVARMEGKVGAKGPQIQVRTTYGTVRLRKS
jgi:DUF4097 and DUF4098 domain-containing protein YvlB